MAISQQESGPKVVLFNLESMVQDISTRKIQNRQIEIMSNPLCWIVNLLELLLPSIKNPTCIILVLLNLNRNAAMVSFAFWSYWQSL